MKIGRQRQMKIKQLTYNTIRRLTGSSGVAKSDGLSRVCERVRQGISLSVLKKDKVEISNKNLPAPNCAGRFFIGDNIKQSLENVKNVHDLEILPIKNNTRVWIKGAPKLQSGINEIVKEVPAVMDIFVHSKAYLPDGLDKHVLAGWKEAVKAPVYKDMSKRKQRIVDLAILLHDHGKIGKPAKTEHAIDSAKLAKKTLESVKMPQKDKKLVVKLIQHHHYAENIAKKKKTYGYYAERFTKKEFELLKLITTADIKSKQDPQKVAPRVAENNVFFSSQAAYYKKPSFMSMIRSELSVSPPKSKLAKS